MNIYKKLQNSSPISSLLLLSSLFSSPAFPFEPHPRSVTTSPSLLSFTSPDPVSADGYFSSRSLLYPYPRIPLRSFYFRLALLSRNRDPSTTVYRSLIRPAERTELRLANPSRGNFSARGDGREDNARRDGRSTGSRRGTARIQTVLSSFPAASALSVLTSGLSVASITT